MWQIAMAESEIHYFVCRAKDFIMLLCYVGYLLDWDGE